MIGTDLKESTDAAPLSFAQERIYYLERMMGGSTAYHMPIALRLRGHLDVRVLDWALGRLVLRHDALRTAIRMDGGEPRQVVLPWVHRALEVEDLAPEHGPVDEERLRLRLEAEARRPFDLGSGAPIRWLLIRCGPNDHVLFQNGHHAFLDGVSHGILVHELAALYDAHVEGRGTDLPSHALTYGQYAIRERAALTAERIEQLTSFWRQQLAGDPPMLDLPRDRARPAVQRFRGRTVHATVSEDVRRTLAHVGREEGATEFMTLLAGFQALMHRYSGQTDLLIGTVVGGRPRTELETIVGCFINTVVVRTDVSGEPTFREVVRRTGRAMFGALAHQDAPYDQVVQAIGPSRSTSYNPLFQVLFRSEEVGRKVPQFGGLQVELVAVEPGGVYCDLDLSVQAATQGARFALHHDVDLFEASTAQRILAHYCTLLRGAAANPECPISALPILPDDERHTLLAWGDGGAPLTLRETVLDVLEGAAHASSSKTAAEDETGATLSYAELHGRARRVAAALRGEGLGRGDVVGVCGERSVGMLVALLGILGSGAAYLPLDLDYPQERIAFMLADSGARAVMCAGAGAAVERIPSSVAILQMEELEAGSLPETPAAAGAEAGPEDPAYLIYTSGSTGVPKGVRVPHRAVASLLRTMMEKPGLGERERVLAVTTIAFDIAVLELLLPLAAGGTAVIATRRSAADGRRLLDLMRERCIDVLQATPATWRLLLDAGWDGDPPLRALCGGEALASDLAASLVERAREVWNLYGPTEATVWCTRQRVTSAESSTPIGRPVRGARAYVLDNAMSPMPIGTVGDLWIGGACVTLGYQGRPELTQERFVRDPFSEDSGARIYRTGDRARWRSDGVLEYHGRRDHQVKVRGFRIELGEVEAALAHVPGIRESVADVSADATGERRLVAWVVGTPGEALTASDVRRRLADLLPDYMVPSLVIEMPALPRTPNGKVDRHALPDAEGSPTEGRDGSPAPSTPLERDLARIWADVLGIDDVGIDDNFFDLGGHSLLCMRAIHRMEEATGRKFDPRAMVLQTLRQIAAEAEPAA